jgi:hypothetical protein
MERIEMLSDIELRIKDIDQRRDELKTWMDNHPDHPQYDEAEKLLFEMNKILDSLRMKFKDLEANISGDQKKLPLWNKIFIAISVLSTVRLQKLVPYSEEREEPDDLFFSSQPLAFSAFSIRLLSYFFQLLSYSKNNKFGRPYWRYSQLQNHLALLHIGFSHGLA